MKTTNFTFDEDSIGLNANGLYLDLHNTFIFRRYAYDVVTRSVELVWEKDSGDWVPASMPAGIILTFEEVRSFAFEPRNPGMPFSEDDCVSSFGFVPVNLPAFIDSAGFPTPQSETDYILWEFQSGAKMRIHAASVRCTVK